MYDVIEVVPKFKVGDRVDCYKLKLLDVEILGVNVGQTVSGEEYISYDIKDGIVLTMIDEKDLCKAKKYIIKKEG